MSLHLRRGGGERGGEEKGDGGSLARDLRRGFGYAELERDFLEVDLMALALVLQ